MKTNKQGTIYLLMMFLFFYSSTSILEARCFSKDKTKDKIELRSNGTTRSGYAYNLNAYIYETSIELIVENYNGNVEISIEQTDIYNILEINELGHIIIDISKLDKERTYILKVFIDGKVYSGFFGK